MICNTSPSPKYMEEFAVFIDMENVVLRLRVENKGVAYPVAVNFFMWELLNCCKAAFIQPSPMYSNVYMERQCYLPGRWHDEVSKITNAYGFKLHWSKPMQPAEELLARHVKELIAQPLFPKHSLLISGDGDLVPTLEALKQWDGLQRQGEVCAIGWKNRFSRHLKKTATGYIFLDNLLKHSTLLLS